MSTDTSPAPATSTTRSAGTAGRIVVGVGGAGSAHASLSAVRWATDESVARQATLRLVHADLWPAVPAQARRRHVAASRRALDSAVRAAQQRRPDVDVDVAVSASVALELLLAESRSAVLVVVGARPADEPRGSGGTFSGALAAALVGDAHCPVVVIPDGELPTGGPVVLGVDGSPGCAAATRIAFESAARAGTGVLAVHAANDTAGHVPSARLSADDDDRRRLVARALAGVRAEFPHVPVTERHSHDRPAESLLDAARGARLVVTGARGRGGFNGMLLGSTSRALVRGCPAPLLVARGS